jgi:hypothetical protein
LEGHPAPGRPPTPDALPAMHILPPMMETAEKKAATGAVRPSSPAHAGRMHRAGMGIRRNRAI